MLATLGLLGCCVAALCQGSQLDALETNSDIGPLNRKSEVLSAPSTKIRKARLSFNKPLVTVIVRNCELEPCENGGTCSDGKTCNCPAGYTGRRCESPQTCDPPCQNSGFCTSYFTCVCKPGYGGNRCEISKFKNQVCNFETDFCLKNFEDNSINFTRTLRSKGIPSPKDNGYYAFIKCSSATDRKIGTMYSPHGLTGTPVRVKFDYLTLGNGKLSFLYHTYVNVEKAESLLENATTNGVWKTANLTIPEKQGNYMFRGYVGGVWGSFGFQGAVAVDNIRVTGINS